MTEIKIQTKNENEIIVIGTDKDLLDYFVDDMLHSDLKYREFYISEIDFTNEPEWKVIIKKTHK